MKQALPIRICSPHKTGVARGELHDLYNEHMLVAFFKRFDEIEDRPYAVLSRKHGICFSGEQYDNYHDREEKNDDELRAILARQFTEFGDKYQFVYWNHRPITHDKWVTMLRQAGFHVDFRSTLNGVAEALKRSCRDCSWIDPGNLISPDDPDSCGKGHEIEEDYDAEYCEDYNDEYKDVLI